MQGTFPLRDIPGGNEASETRGRIKTQTTQTLGSKLGNLSLTLSNHKKSKHNQK